MRRIRIQNPILDKNYKTQLAADYSSGVGLTVINNAAFAADDILVVGEPSEEKTEGKTKLSSIATSTGMTISSALNFSHGKGTAIYKTLWDKLSIESRSSSLGTFAEIAEINIQWDNHNNETVYYDSNGNDNYEYRFRFHNSDASTYSEYSPTLGGTGFSRESVGYMIREIRKIVNDLEKKIVSDNEIIRFLNRAQDIVYAHNPRYFFLKVDTYKDSDGIAATAGEDVYSLAQYETLGHIDVVRYKYESGNVERLYTLEKKQDLEFDALTTDLNRGNDDWVACYKLLPRDSSSDKGYLQIDPAPTNTGVGTLYPKYYEKMANLDSVEDETQVPMPDILEDFAISQIERVKGNEAKSQQYLELFLGPKDQRGGFENITGLKLLDKMDNAQKDAVGQPRQLWSYKGRRALSRTLGNPRMNRDNIKENYMD